MITWQIDGLEELKAQLRSAAGGAARTRRAGFSVAGGNRRHRHPHRLSRAHAGTCAAACAVSQRGGNGNYGAAAQVINRAQHACIFEKGTQARHTDLDADRGTMPAGNVFIPRAIKHRARMINGSPP